MIRTWFLYTFDTILRLRAPFTSFQRIKSGRKNAKLYIKYWQFVLRYFHGTFRYFNLILKGVKEPSELERGTGAHEVRRSAEWQ